MLRRVTLNVNPDLTDNLTCCFLANYYIREVVVS